MKQLLSILLFSIALSASQVTYEPGDTRGFEGHTAHQIIEYGDPITVALVQGTILDSSDAPLREALFEIRGPGKSLKVRGVKTDSKGNFQIRQVPDGTYRFQASSIGFNSVFGTLVVSQKADRNSWIRVGLHVGT